MAILTDVRPTVLALLNETTRLNLRVVDANGTPVNATALRLSIRDMADTEVYADDFFSPPSPPGVTRIVNPAVGEYYFPLGDPTLFPLTVGGDDNAETANVRRLAAVWFVTGPNSSESVPAVQRVQVVTARTLMLINQLKSQIDKANMQVSEDPDNPCFIGYTDGNLFDYLKGGLETWNMYEPYPTFLGLDDFPEAYEQGLIDAAMLVGVQSQELFAVATDIPQYSANGASFTLSHQPALAAFFNARAQRLDKLIPVAKLKLVRSGSLHTQMQPSYRLRTLMESAPSGSLFRNVYFRS